MNKAILLSLSGLMCLYCSQSSTAPSENANPVIISLTAYPAEVQVSDTFKVICEAYDPDGQPLAYDWAATSGSFVKGENTSLIYRSDKNELTLCAVDSIDGPSDTTTVYCNATDGIGGNNSARVYIIIFSKDTSAVGVPVNN